MPKYWKIGKTILIPKAGNLDFADANSWRPIALLNTSYKVFTYCLARQLQYWVEGNKLFHRNQKSLAIHKGCVEHNFALNTMIEHNLKNRIATYICFIDIENAFPSVTYELLFGLLAKHGVNQDAINIIESLYKDSSNIIHVDSMKVGPFQVNKGVRQGGPLSMFLFNIAINQVLFAVDPDQIAFKILAYADDIAITSTSLDKLQSDVNKANALIQWCGMKVKPAKCGLLSHQPPLRFGRA